MFVTRTGGVMLVETPHAGQKNEERSSPTSTRRLVAARDVDEEEPTSRSGWIGFENCIAAFFPARPPRLEES
jgi:hypothetical protein